MRTTYNDGVGILEIDTAGNNIINPAFIAEINAHLDDLETDGRVRAIVLTAQHKTMFSPGLDVITLYHLSYAETRTFVRDFCKLYVRLFSFPRPLIVAVNGHAIAGGLLLAAAADFRIIKSGDVRMGLTEIDLGLPLPAGCIEMLRYALSHQAIEQLIYSGKLFTPSEALAINLVDQIVEEELLLRTAFERARALAQKSQKTFQKMKDYLREDYVDRIEQKDEEHLDALLDYWTSEEARSRLSPLIEKLKARKQ